MTLYDEKVWKKCGKDERRRKEGAEENKMREEKTARIGKICIKLTFSIGQRL